MTTGQARWDGPARQIGFAASKVPLITGFFWTIKLLSTAMGEATSDYMVKIMNPVIAVLLGFIGFVIAMVLQFRAKRYNAWIYWLAVSMVAVFGTMAADVLHIKFGVPYLVSTVFFAIVLAIVFVVWYRSEGTLSIHSIRTPRREFFYWATVLSTFALGTATGDLTAKTLSLGYLASGVLFSVAFGTVALAHWKFGLNPITGFWIAYVLTRPVGASFADYVAFPKSVGGLDTGHGPVALTLALIIVALVGYLAVTRRDVEEIQNVRDPRRPQAVHGGPRHGRADASEPWSQPRPRPDRPVQARPPERPWPDQRRPEPPWQDRPGFEPSGPGRLQSDRLQSDRLQSGRPEPGRPEPDWQRPERLRPERLRPDRRRQARPQRAWDRGEEDREPEGFFMWDER